MAIESLTPAYVVSTGDFADYACFACAHEFATQRGLTWNSSSYDFTVEDPETSDHVCVVYSWEGAECDYPVSCTTWTNGELCGQYLDNVRLTSDGVMTLIDNAEDYPAWLLEAHGIELTDNN
jgi:hypothetical protein